MSKDDTGTEVSQDDKAAASEPPSKPTQDNATSTTGSAAVPDAKVQPKQTKPEPKTEPKAEPETSGRGSGLHR